MRALNQIFDFGSDFFKRQAQLTAQRIREDALKGKFQNGASGSKLSPKYAKYKANFMQRFTTRKYKTGMVANKGTKLKSYMGVSIKSNEFKFSNMYLTGQTLDSLQPSQYDGYGFTLTFNNPMVNKRIIGNELRGRVIADLSEKNIDLILVDMNKKLDESIEQYCREDINITVG